MDELAIPSVGFRCTSCGQEVPHWRFEGTCPACGKNGFTRITARERPGWAIAAVDHPVGRPALVDAVMDLFNPPPGENMDSICITALKRVHEFITFQPCACSIEGDGACGRCNALGQIRMDRRSW